MPTSRVEFHGNNTFDIRDFLALPGQDCTAAIVAAKTAAAAVNGCVYIPPGIWLSDPFTFDGCDWYGLDPATTTIKANAGSADWATNTPTGIVTVDKHVQGICFDGTNLTGSAAVVKLANGRTDANSPSFHWTRCRVQNGPATGMDTSGLGGSVRGSTFDDVMVYGNHGAGWSIGADQSLVSCIAGANGLQGFFSNGHSAFYLANLKSYANGTVTPNSGHGFHVAGEGTGASAVGCQAQDNQAAGLLFDSSNGSNGGVVFEGFVADSNSKRSAGANPAVQFFNYIGGTVSFTSISRDVATCFQRNALTFSGSTRNTAVCYQHGNIIGAQAVQGYLSSTTSVMGNTVRLGNDGGTQAPVFAASYTPDLALGRVVAPGLLTNNITVNAPTNPVPGNVYEFFFTQDGTGGRTVSWNAAFVFQAAWTNTGNTLGKRSTARFLYDGTNYISLESAANVWF